MKIRYAKNLITGSVETQSGGTEGVQSDLDLMESNMIGDGASGLTPANVEVGWEEEAIVSEWAKSFTDSLKTYADKRKSEYPPATDYLDAIVKGDQAQIDKYIADCLAVKQRHPK